jgi:hypothetical protein
MENKMKLNENLLHWSTNVERGINHNTELCMTAVNSVMLEKILNMLVQLQETWAYCQLMYKIINSCHENVTPYSLVDIHRKSGEKRVQ